jgi:hypothetical protein
MFVSLKDNWVNYACFSMKKLVYIFALFAFVLLLDSCAKEDIRPVTDDNFMECGTDNSLGKEDDPNSGNGSISDPDDKDLESDEDDDTIGDPDEDDDEGEEDNDIVSVHEEGDGLGG